MDKWEKRRVASAPIYPLIRQSINPGKDDEQDN
jgi:hypothetical protein